MWELLPPPSPQSGARAPPPPPRFRFPRRHLRHGRFRHRLHPGPDTAGQKREAAALRAALGQREAYLSPEEGRSRRCPAEVPGAVRAGGEGTARRVRAAEVPSPKMAAGAGFSRREDGGGGSGALGGWRNSLGRVRGAGWDRLPQTPLPSRGLPTRPRRPRLSPADHKQPPEPSSRSLCSQGSPSPPCHPLILGLSLLCCMRDHCGWAWAGGYPLPAYPSTLQGSCCSILF